MKCCKKILVLITVLLNIIPLNGCWNYREIDQLAIVAGIAIDKGINEKFSITVEIVEITSGGTAQSETTSKIITFEGKTIFDTSRHVISVSGKKLYWGHAKIAIISQEIATQGVVQVLDWFSRDAETRADIKIVISKEHSAKDILATKGLTEKVTSFEINEILNSHQSLSDTPKVEVWMFNNRLVAKGISPIAPAIDLKQINGESVPHITGCAIFDGDRLIGFLDNNDTKSMLFILNEIKGGVIIAESCTENEKTTASCEIFRNKTKVKPVINNGNIEMDINIETDVAIDEISSSENIINVDTVKKLEASAEKILKDRIESVIAKVQSDFGVDAFGFGAKLYENKPKIWNLVADSWKDKFKDLKVNVNVKVNIINSAMLAKPLEVND